jgi:hypothetical protein
VLNGHVLRPGRKIDWQAQYESAIEAFGKQGFCSLCTIANWSTWKTRSISRRAVKSPH